MLLPLKKLIERYDRDSSESDFTAFNTLLLIGEFLTKLITLVMVSSLDEDRDRFKYSVSKDLVKADGIGDWSRKIDLILTGPNSGLVNKDYHELTKQLTQRVTENEWQYSAVANIATAAESLGISVSSISGKTALRQWFQIFSELRNKTRGHGALPPAICAQAVPKLKSSIFIIIDNLCLCAWEWAYLHRNMSGKYRVTPMSNNARSFDYLKSSTSYKLPNGIYIYHTRPHPVDLLTADQDLADFFVPNGAFSQKEYSIISYITGATSKADSTPWHMPSTSLPPSETQGKSQIDLMHGSVFTNLPDPTIKYVHRPALESRLSEALTSDRHEIVTLTGPGGIGKLLRADYFK